MKGFISAKEFADSLGVSAKVFDRMLEAGQIPQPLPRVQGGKRVWLERVVREIVGGEAA